MGFFLICSNIFCDVDHFNICFLFYNNTSKYNRKMEKINYRSFIQWMIFDRKNLIYWIYLIGMILLNGYAIYHSDELDNTGLVVTSAVLLATDLGIIGLWVERWITFQKYVNKSDEK